MNILVDISKCTHPHTFLLGNSRGVELLDHNWGTHVFEFSQYTKYTVQTAIMSVWPPTQLLTL